jgi:hypothetical protein
VDDLLADVDGCPVEIECLLDRFDGALDACTETAGRGEKDSLDQTEDDGSWAAPGALRGAFDPEGWESPVARGVVAAGLSLLLTAAS